MRYYLSSVKIEGFRGINNETDPLALRFRTDCVNSVFAENAVGKSSIFEALCYAIRGNVPKLRSLQEQEEPDSYIANRFHSKKTATIHLQLTPDDGSAPISIQVTRSATGVRTVTSPSSHADPVGLLASLNEDFALLDYSTFQAFIDNTPLQRGRSFAALLGLSRYGSFTQAMRSVADTRALNSDLDISSLRTSIAATEEASQNAIRRLAQAYEKLTGKQLADTANLGANVSDVTVALNGVALVKDHVEGKALEEIDFEKVNERIRNAEQGDKRKQLDAALTSISRLKALGDADPGEIGREQARFKALIVQKAALLAGTRGKELKALYDAADIFLRSGEWAEPDKCPLCETGGLAAPIATTVTGKLHQYDKVADQEAAIRNAWAGSLLSKRLRNLESARDLGVREEGKVLNRLSRCVEANQLDDAAVDEAVSVITSLERKLTDAIRAAEALKDELEKSLPPSLVRLAEQVQAAAQFRDALTDLRQSTAKKDEEARKLALRERWQTFVAKASKTFAEAESDLAQRKIAEIDSDYKDMFARIMNVKDVVPELNRHDDRQDLHVHLRDFHGLSNLSARALLSESFRNALAVSVFLSAALKHTGAPRFVVLDDVTSSFDSGHQWLLMEAIRLSFQQPNNPGGLQFIIFSHDGLLAKYFDKLGSTSDWHHQKLQGMPPIGAVTSNVQDSDRLKTTALRLLGAGQTAEAQPLLRQYLEFKLLQVITKVSIPVPLDFAIKDHQKMVSNCLAGC
jgi:recombinational DNA repair ATPase RecF